MEKQNPASDFLQFLIGGCLFGAGGFLLANQVMVRSAMIYGNTRGRYGYGGMAVPWGTPGMGLLMIPLAIGVCMLFAGSYKRWANLLIWASLAALFVGIINSVRMSFMPTTLWQLGVYVVMIAAGGGLMFKGLNRYEEKIPELDNTADLRRELDELRRSINRDS